MTPDWRTQAACRGLDPELMFPPRGADATEALAVCVRCAVREPCLDDAYATRARGVLGGTTEQQRRQERKKGRGRRPRPGIAHGTDGGYAAHLRRGEPACEACLGGHRIAQAARKAAKAVAS